MKEIRVMKHRQGGWAIVSTMIAIVIGLIMLGGLFVIFDQAWQGQIMETEQRNIAATRLNIQNLYRGSPNYNGLTTAVGTSAEVFPSDMIKTAGIRNSWNGAVTLGTASGNTQFTMSWAAVPRASCIKLATFGYGSWAAVTANGTTIPQSGGGAVGAAATACNNDTNNTLVFTSN